MKNVLCFMILLTSISCSKEVKEAMPDCGCDGPSNKVLNNVLSIYRVSTISEVDPKGYFYSFCNPSFIDKKITAGDTVLVSGKIRSNCFTGETIIAIPALLEITAIRKK